VRCGEWLTCDWLEGKRVRKCWDDVRIPPLTTIKVDPKLEVVPPSEENPELQPSFWKIVRKIYPTIPYKPLLFLGFFTCVASGATTPVFLFLMSRLPFEVSTGAHDISTINFFRGIVLCIAALDGMFMGLKYFLMEAVENA